MIPDAQLCPVPAAPFMECPLSLWPDLAFSPGFFSLSQLKNHLVQLIGLQPGFRLNSVWFQSGRGDTQTRKWSLNTLPATSFFTCHGSTFGVAANIHPSSSVHDAGSENTSHFGWWNVSRLMQVAAFRCHLILGSAPAILSLIPGGHWSRMRKHLEETWAWQSGAQCSQGLPRLANPQILKQEEVFAIGNHWCLGLFDTQH